MAENNSSAPLKTAEGAELETEITEHIAEADALCRKLYNRYGYAQPAQDAREWIQIAKQLLADTAQAVAAQTAPAAVAVPEITDAMVDAYLAEQRRTVEEADRLGRPNIGGLHTNTVRDACRNGLRAALAATPALPATESVLIEGVAYTIPEAVALELLRLNIELQQIAEVQAEPVANPGWWREQFSQAVYADLAAADNQDIPLEEYPGRILKVLDSIVGPHHPTVVHWRNDAIRACIEIVKRYGAGTTAYQERDMAALYTAPQAQPAPVQAKPVGVVESSLRFTGGFHVRLAHGATMPEPGTMLYTAPQPADALDAELLELVRATVAFKKERGSVLQVHIDNMADLLEERDAQAAAQEGGNGATGKDGAA